MHYLPTRLDTFDTSHIWHAACVKAKKHDAAAIKICHRSVPLCQTFWYLVDIASRRNEQSLGAPCSRKRTKLSKCRARSRDLYTTTLGTVIHKANSYQNKIGIQKSPPGILQLLKRPPEIPQKKRIPQTPPAIDLVIQIVTSPPSPLMHRHPWMHIHQVLRSRHCSPAINPHPTRPPRRGLLSIRAKLPTTVPIPAIVPMRLVLQARRAPTPTLHFHCTLRHGLCKHQVLVVFLAEAASDGCTCVGGAAPADAGL